MVRGDSEVAAATTSVATAGATGETRKAATSIDRLVHGITDAYGASCWTV